MTKFYQLSYIRELLSFSSHESTLGLRSADDPYHLHEPRAIGERGFANHSFSYIVPHLYNKLPITIKLIDSLNTFKSHLKAFFFSVPMISQVLLFRKIMHCTFLVFLLIIFFFLSLFSSAREFRFIERIGAHGKQKSRFYHSLLLYTMTVNLCLVGAKSITKQQKAELT